jgi:large subunit ribosomal protein L29
MKMLTLRDMTKEELLQKRHELAEEIFNLRMRKTFKELDNPLKLRTIRRDIARIGTILNEDELNIRKIVDTPVSILDKKLENEPFKETEEGKKE